MYKNFNTEIGTTRLVFRGTLGFMEIYQPDGWQFIRSLSEKEVERIKREVE